MNVKEFEFSQAHFWDKFERSNHFLEAIMRPLEPVDDRTIHFLLSIRLETGAVEHGHEPDQEAWTSSKVGISRVKQ